jgi:hypothetical protein
MVRASDCPSSPREEKIGETFDFARGKIHTEANNLGRIVVVSPNA